MTRRAGFSAKSAVQLQTVTVGGYSLAEGEILDIQISFPAISPGEWVGFGGWFSAPPIVTVEVVGLDRPLVLAQGNPPNWGKFGSLWVEHDPPVAPITIRFTANGPANVAVWDVMGGRVDHEYLQSARAELLTNMWRFAPEANFYDPKAEATLIIQDRGLRQVASAATIHLKSCNRCGRFLPVNLADERFQLSFSNHCVAAHRRPCSHTGFGRILNTTTTSTVQLDYGFQLECRFCKKFEVNAAHNPQRTAAQMKEDAARRRAFELLLEHLYEGTPQLRFRAQTGRELANDVWERFGHRCFKCETPLASARDMHLDHTRPLALLWPLDGSATALCATHNSEKRDKPPGEFYSPEELRRLANITGIPLLDLQDPSPNLEAIRMLGERLEWFFRDFLTQPELAETRDGKHTADLLVKALQKALEACPGGAPFKLEDEARRYA